MSTRIALFSHFNIGPMPHYVKVYLTELRKHVDQLILIHNDSAPYGVEEDRFCAKIDIARRAVPNEGFDFGMWSRFTDLLAPPPAELVLANDSCVPVRSFSSLFDAARASGSAAFGVTDSRGLNIHHLQSYFLILKPAATAIMARRLRNRGVVSGTVDDVIRHHELGFSTALIEAGLQIGSAFQVHQNYHLNPSILDAPTLLEAGAPLLKRRLLQRRVDRGSYKRYLRVWGRHPGTELIRHVPPEDLMQIDWLGHTPEFVIADAARGAFPPPPLQGHWAVTLPMRRALRQVLGKPDNVAGYLPGKARQAD